MCSMCSPRYIINRRCLWNYHFNTDFGKKIYRMSLLFFFYSCRHVLMLNISHYHRHRKMSKARYLINGTVGIFWILVALGLCYFYHTTFKYTSSVNLNVHVSQLPLLLSVQHDNIFLAIEAWRKVLRKLKKSWHIARLGCALILP